MADLQPYHVVEVWAPDGVLTTCGNCDWEGPIEDLQPIESCALTAGDPSPAGRCPECGTLAYIKET